MRHEPHTVIYALICFVFIIMSGAMFRLYREELNTKHMISEGFMQMKEDTRSYIKDIVLDKIVMKDGKMSIQRNGSITNMDKEMILLDETKVMTNGTIQRKNGTKMTLKNGEAIDMNGQILSR